MDTSGPKPQLPRWFWIASIYFGVAFFDATQTVVVMHAEGMHHYWARLFFTTLLSWLPWAVATPIVMYLGRLSWRSTSTWLAHLAACAGIGFVYAAWNAAMVHAMNPLAMSPSPGPYLSLWLNEFYNQLLSSIVLYGCTLLVGHTLDSREHLARQQTEAARLNEQLSKAQLNALRQQIEPHFLFNTLNAIAGLVREKKNDAAVGMIVALSDFLRRVLEESNRQQVPLGEELEFLQKYLDIQKIRFADRLQWKLEVPEELFAARVPALILQPIVENAVKHGIAQRAQGGMIRVSAARADGMLTLTVHNDGPSLPADWEQARPGIGISNVRERLQGLYGPAFRWSMHNQAPGGVEVSFSVPFKES
jgi:two-component system, LytTR family, sensor kinase